MNTKQKMINLILDMGLCQEQDDWLDTLLNQDQFDFAENFGEILRISKATNHFEDLPRNSYTDTCIFREIAREVFFYKNSHAHELPHGSYLINKYGYHDDKAFHCQNA